MTAAASNSDPERPEERNRRGIALPDRATALPR